MENGRWVQVSTGDGYGQVYAVDSDGRLFELSETAEVGSGKWEIVDQLPPPPAREGRQASACVWIKFEQLGSGNLEIGLARVAALQELDDGDRRVLTVRQWTKDDTTGKCDYVTVLMGATSIYRIEMVTAERLIALCREYDFTLPPEFTGVQVVSEEEPLPPGIEPEHGVQLVDDDGNDEEEPIPADDEDGIGALLR